MILPGGQLGMLVTPRHMRGQFVDVLRRQLAASEDVIGQRVLRERARLQGMLDSGAAAA